MKKIFLTTLISVFFTFANAQDYWRFITGLPIATALAFESDNQGNVLIGSLTGGLFSTSDNDSVWHSAALQGIYVHALVKDSSGRIYAGTENQGLLRSSDNFSTYDNLGIPNHFINDVLVPSPGLIIAATDTGVYVSTNDGYNWNLNGLAGKDIQSLSFSNQGVLYARANPGLYISQDTGFSWQSFSTGISSACNTTCLYLSASQEIFAGTEFCGLYKYNSGISTWEHFALDSLHVTSLDENSQNHLFVSTYNGPFYSLNNGSTWQLLGDTLDRDNLAKIFINSSGYVYVNVCCGYGIYRSNYSTIEPSSINNPKCEETIISDFGFFPNPFSEKSQFFFTLNKSANATISLYSITGAKIAEVSDFFKSQERNALSLGGSELQAGTYIITLKTKEQQVFQKIIKIFP